MTEQRDPDRITRAWLDLMPSEAPDRAIAAVLQATETTPQVRRLPRPASWRFPRMNKLSFMTAGVVVVAVGITGALIATGEPDVRVGQPPPSGEASPTSSPGTVRVPDQLVGQWFGGVRPAVPETGDVDEVWMELTERTVFVGARRGEQTIAQFHGGAGGANDRLRIETLVASPMCARGDVGTYGWSLSPNGHELTIDGAADECAARSSTFTGTWYKRDCARVIGTCIGDLAPGTHRSWDFTTGLEDGRWKPALGVLTYSVPEGWTNSHDFPAGYWLERTDWHDDLVARSNGRDPGERPESHGIYLFSRPGPLVVDPECSVEFDPTVGTSAEELAAWLMQHPALETTQAHEVRIGSLNATYVDARVADDWTGACGDDPPGVLLFAAIDGSPSRGQYDWGTVTGLRERYILVDVAPERTVIVNISAPEAEFDALIADAMPIVETFEFN